MFRLNIYKVIQGQACRYVCVLCHCLLLWLHFVVCRWLWCWHVPDLPHSFHQSQQSRLCVSHLHSIRFSAWLQQFSAKTVLSSAVLSEAVLYRPVQSFQRWILLHLGSIRHPKYRQFFSSSSFKSASCPYTELTSLLSVLWAGIVWRLGWTTKESSLYSHK
jgi:hypothetical protein